MYLVTGGGLRVQTDGTGPPVLREMLRRLNVIQSEFWKAYRNTSGTPQP